MARNDENVTIEDARVVFRNFAGREGMYNRAGDRNFAILLDKPLADELSKAGWNVKTLRPREEGDEPQPYISVTVGYKGRPPTIVMITSKKRTQLDEESVETLDWIDTDQVDVVIRPYDWDVNGNTGRKAYLQSMYVVVNEDPLALKYDMTGDIASVDGPMMERTDPYNPED